MVDNSLSATVFQILACLCLRHQPTCCSSLPHKPTCRLDISRQHVLPNNPCSSFIVLTLVKTIMLTRCRENAQVHETTCIWSEISRRSKVGAVSWRDRGWVTYCSLGFGGAGSWAGPHSLCFGKGWVDVTDVMWHDLVYVHVNQVLFWDWARTMEMESCVWQ